MKKVEPERTDYINYTPQCILDAHKELLNAKEEAGKSWDIVYKEKLDELYKMLSDLKAQREVFIEDATKIKSAKYRRLFNKEV